MEALYLSTQDLGHLIQVLNRHIFRYFVKVGDQLGISSMEVVFLNFFFENATQPIYQTDLERTFNIRSSTATTNVKLMVKKGLIKQIEDADDKRRKVLQPTDKALKLKEPLTAAQRQLERELTQDLSPVQREDFQQFLLAAIQNLTL
jgi:DNA-binding MarR family transcriptional regulator